MKRFVIPVLAATVAVLGVSAQTAAASPGSSPTPIAKTTPVATPTAAAATAGVRPAAVSYPPLRLEIGRTPEGRQIRAVRQGDPKATKVLVVLGQMHGNEKQAPLVVSAVRRLVTRPGTAVWTIMTMNPDGAARGWRYNAAWIDLNRNFPTSGRYLGGLSGAWAWTQPETRAVAGFLTRLRPDAVVSFHQPFNLVDGDNPKNVAWAVKLAAWTGVPAGIASCGGACYGTLTGWFNRTMPGWAMTFELSSSPTQAHIDQVAWVLVNKLAPAIRDFR